MNAYRLFVFLKVLVLMPKTNVAYDHVTVTMPAGPVQGDVINLNSGKRINAFLGIPFAETPIGSLRWRAPESIRWSELFVADTLGNACIQNEDGPIAQYVTYSEDCLNLNIYAPNTTGSYPVLVWFHGGGFQYGSNIQYAGYFLAEKDTVVVVPNYRLNIMGFITTADSAARGNYGMLDQLAALQWVQANIGAFGGDPRQVTIFGESAGAHSVGLHLVSPLSRGLFHGAILMSGSELNSVNLPESQPEEMTRQVAVQHGCLTGDSFTMMDCLRDVNAKELFATNFTCAPGYSCAMISVVDGVYLPDQPINLRQAGDVARVPEMIGVTAEESTVLVAINNPSFLVKGPNRTEFEELVSDIVDYYMPRLPDQSQRDDLVASLTWYYSPWPHLDDRDLNRYQFSMMSTDFHFGASADFQMKMHARLPAPVFQYVFDYMSDNAHFPEWMGAWHSIDVQYTWGYPQLFINPEALNHSRLVDIANYTETDLAYADFMMTLITDFAKTRDMSLTPVPTPVGDPPVTWLPHTIDQLNYLYMGNDFVGMRENFRQHEYALWNSYLNNMVYNHPWPFPDTDVNSFDFLFNDELFGNI